MSVDDEDDDREAELYVPARPVVTDQEIWEKYEASAREVLYHLRDVVREIEGMLASLESRAIAEWYRASGFEPEMIRSMLEFQRRSAQTQYDMFKRSFFKS